MQENNSIYKIATQIKDKENIKNDFREVLVLASDWFKKKYIDTLQKEIDTHFEKVQKNPTKEVSLLKAIKPFIKDDSHEDIDKFIDTLVNINVFNTLKDKVISLNETTEETTPLEVPSLLLNTSDAVKASNINKKNLYYNDNPDLGDDIENNFIDDSVKIDGVYDIDENCIFSSQSKILDSSNILIILVIFFLIFKN